MHSDNIHRMTGWRIAAAVQKGELTAEQVANCFIERVRMIDPTVQAWAHTDEAYYLRQARALDASPTKGPLAGVPVAVKDIFNTEVLPTEMGSPIWRGHKAGNDARCVSYVRRDGGLIAGKTDTAEFAVHARARARNPWNLEHVTGSSSGGSAVAVATAMAPLALATQTAGSTIRPASWCGVFGMKPSFGMIPRTGVLKTTDTLDNIGFYGRDARDLRLFLDSLRVRGRNFPILERQLTAFTTPLDHPWRIALIRSPFDDEAPDYVHASMAEIHRVMGGVAGVELVETVLPESTRDILELHRRLYNTCLAYYFGEELRNAPELISEEFHSLVEDGKTISPADYAIALEQQSHMANEMASFFAEGGFDLILHHSSNGSAPKGAEPIINRDLNALWTLTRLPVVNVPAFLCPNGLPYGYQLIGPRYSDYRVLTFLEFLVRRSLAPEVAAIPEPPLRGYQVGECR
jgi:Asp-tRNA(Asn)/Glu-tRNA(Gln) amidotransferase A subunit family amidase